MSHDPSDMPDTARRRGARDTLMSAPWFGDPKEAVAAEVERMKEEDATKAKSTKVLLYLAIVAVLLFGVLCVLCAGGGAAYYFLA